jgi:salicylate hydroxylase
MSSSTPFRIIICGGGIAGMSAAIALRAPNRDITVLERSALASEIGATISLQPNASRILQSVWKVDSMAEARGMSIMDSESSTPTATWLTRSLYSTKSSMVVSV